MAIMNRDLDVTQQMDTIQASFGVVATGATVVAAMVPSQSTLQAVKVSAFGLSGSPTYDLRILRFIVGAGVTSIAGGATTLTPLTFGTSGMASMVLASAGSTLLNLLPNDLITLTSGGSNAAATVAVAVVVQNIQDLKQSFGVPATT